MSRTLAQALHDFQPELPLAVAYSGGADSTALLLACSEKWPGQVWAIHVNHGLQAAAIDFEQHCCRFCTSLGVPLSVQSVNAQAMPGQSPEDAARRARYHAIRQAVQDSGAGQPAIRSVALAQHADDQVETILLALSRGAGLAGLSAMPSRWQRDGIHYHRPLLEVPGAELRNWLVTRGVSCIDDPTNSDVRFTRNRIRAHLLPALQTVFPQFRETFSRSAAHVAQAQVLLTDLAVQDLNEIGLPPVLRHLQMLSRSRQGNALRHWLKTTYGVIASTAQLDELLDQIAACTTRGHQIDIKVGLGRVQREGERLTWYNP